MSFGQREYVYSTGEYDLSYAHVDHKIILIPKRTGCTVQSSYSKHQIQHNTCITRESPKTTDCAYVTRLLFSLLLCLCSIKLIMIDMTGQ